jgi:hypothetical protein
MFRSIVAVDIPTLDASKITTGAFADAQIASAVTWNAKISTVTNDTTSRTANTFYAAPNGSAGTAMFRSIVAVDIPALGYLPLTGGTLTGALSSTSYLTLNGATRQAWAATYRVIQIGGNSSIVEADGSGDNFGMANNLYTDSANNRSISATGTSSYLGLSSTGQLYYTAVANNGANGIIALPTYLFKVDISGNGSFLGSLSGTSATFSSTVTASQFIANVPSSAAGLVLNCAYGSAGASRAFQFSNLAAQHLGIGTDQNSAIIDIFGGPGSEYVAVYAPLNVYSPLWAGSLAVSGSTALNGPVNSSVAFHSANYSILQTDPMVHVFTAAASVTLPNASLVPGAIYIILRRGFGFTVSIAYYGGLYANGNSGTVQSYGMGGDNVAILTSDGVTWYMLGH